jgi:hypothetical protein
MLISQFGELTGAPQILHVSGVIGVTSGAGVVVSFRTSTARCSATRRLRVSFAFLAASLRFFAAMLAFFVTAALTPAARCFLVAAAFFAMALRFVAFFMGGSISGRAIIVLAQEQGSDCTSSGPERGSRQLACEA